MLPQENCDDIVRLAADESEIRGNYEAAVKLYDLIGVSTLEVVFLLSSPYEIRIMRKCSAF